MLNFLFASTLALAAPAIPQLNLQQQASLRCAAAFAVVATRQERGEAQVNAWPAMNPRGKEFFVRAGAQLMDETGITREQLSALFAVEAESFKDEQKLANAMPGCLLLLDASGI